MPQRRNETDRQHMDRLREARGLPPQTADNLMERTRAAVCFVNTTNSETSKLNAFLALFHPEIEAGSPKWIGLMQDAEERQRRDW